MWSESVIQVWIDDELKPKQHGWMVSTLLNQTQNFFTENRVREMLYKAMTAVRDSYEQKAAESRLTELDYQMGNQQLFNRSAREVAEPQATLEQWLKDVGEAFEEVEEESEATPMTLRISRPGTMITISIE